MQLIYNLCINNARMRKIKAKIWTERQKILILADSESARQDDLNRLD